MLQLEISANVRGSHGKGAARVLRSKGLTPAILYGSGTESVSLELDTKSFTKTLLGINRRNALINLDVLEGKKKSTRHVVIKELQTDPIQDDLLHADFCEVSLEKPMILEVPIELTGKAKGVDLGGILQVSMVKVPMKGKILDFPDSLSIDISDLAIEDGLTCKDLTIDSKMEILAGDDSLVVFVADPAKVKVIDYDEEEETAAAAKEAPEEAGAAEGEAAAE
ncbi:MAG: 50S ribosomal protein L25 [Desulfobulbaceae bacterium]|nr:50S ribosomal protein L25 [Desulfobulbaceae bacterium]